MLAPFREFSVVRRFLAKMRVDGVLSFHFLSLQTESEKCLIIKFYANYIMRFA